MARRGGNPRVSIQGDADGVKRATRDAETSLDRMAKSGSKSLHTLKVAGLAAGAALAGGVVVGLKESAEAAIEAEKANARLEAQLKALNISYQAHEKQIQRTLDAHSQLSGFDDEDLGDSFTNIVRIVGDVNKALDLNTIAMDFARAKHMDVAKAGELVGKVAGGNTGILSRYGIQVKEGATATEALGMLQQKFAGQAEAYGKTTAGANDRARVALENLGETIGARVTPLIARAAEGFSTLVRQITLGQGPGGRIRAVFERIAAEAVTLAGAIRGVVQWFQRHRTATTVLMSVVAGLTAAFVAYKIATIAAAVATRTLAAATLALNVVMRANPIGIVVTALIALGAGLVVAYKRSETFRRIVDLAFTVAKRNALSVANVVKAVVVPAFNALKVVADKVGDAVGFIARAFGSLKGAVGGAGGWIGGALDKLGDGLGAMDITGLGGSGGLMGADPDLGPFAAIGRGMGLQVSSGLRPGSVTSSGNQSYHATGDAIDMSGPPGSMMRFATSMRHTFGGRLRELIYTPMGSGIKDGRPYQYSGQVAQDHFDHVHLAFTGPFGDGIGQAVNAARAAGFRGQALINAVAIAGAESRYDAEAKNLKYPDHSIGMWQINQLAHKGKYGSDAALMNPFANARAAFAISGGGRNFGPWSTWPSAAGGWLARARAAVSGSGGRAGGGPAGSGNTAIGGGGGQGSVTGGPGNTASGIGDTRLDVRTGGFALGVARAERGQARAQARDDLSGMIKALSAERALKRKRLRLIRKVLKGTLSKARRLRLVQEETQLIGEIGDLTETIKEYKADQGGGATTISRADELEAGVDTSAADVGGGGADTGGGAASDSGASALTSIMAEVAANQRRLIALAEQQGPTIVGAVVAAVNGSIGGRVGLGFQGIRSPAGSVAGL